MILPIREDLGERCCVTTITPLRIILIAFFLPGNYIVP